jgi:hypothetical protein
MVSDDELREDFARRLNDACERLEIKNRGRAGAIRAELTRRGHKISIPGVQKWLDGEAMPGIAHMHELADWLGTTPAALHYGDAAASAGNPIQKLNGYAKLIAEECLSLKKSVRPHLPLVLGLLNGTVKELPANDVGAPKELAEIFADSAISLDAYFAEASDTKAAKLKGQLLKSFELRLEARRQRLRRMDDNPGQGGLREKKVTRTE